MVLNVSLGKDSYDIVIERGCLNYVDELINLGRKVLIVTDDGVPKAYAQAVLDKAKDGYIVTVEQGEDSKSFKVLERLCSVMLEKGFSRSDAVVAVGGGVVGDLAGFAASIYMRGIDFYNIPTTLLSQVDSSVGGKTAVNLNGIKNIVGAFYQPKKVLIDPDVLKTLPQKQVANGFGEAIKVSLTSDKELFEIIEKNEPTEVLEDIIEHALKVKIDVVQKDEKESGLRKVLNFGHTIGHGIESVESKNGMYHGECVAVGMIPMCSEAVLKRLLPVLKKCGLPTAVNCDIDEVFGAITHDKKAQNDSVTLIKVDEIGKFKMETVDMKEIYELIKRCKII